MSLECTNNGDKHQHNSVEDILVCYGLVPKHAVENNKLGAGFGWSGPHATPARPPSTPPAATRGALRPATESQVWKVGQLGGDVAAAKLMNIRDCSEYIEKLINGKATPPVIVPAKVTPPIKKEKKTLEYDLLDLLQKGYYAIQTEANQPWKFFYVSRPTSGNYKGTIKVQQQHGSGYGQRFSLVYIGYTNTKNTICFSDKLEEEVLILISSQQQAMRNYSEQMKRCCRCNAELTDARSLWYGIGPECEKSNPGLIEDIGLEKGFFEEQK